MKKLIVNAAGVIGVLVSAAAVPTPVLAQAGNFTLVIYGNDPCPREDDLHSQEGERSISPSRR